MEENRAKPLYCDKCLLDNSNEFDSLFSNEREISVYICSFCMDCLCVDCATRDTCYDSQPHRINPSDTKDSDIFSCEKCLPGPLRGRVRASSICFDCEQYLCANCACEDESRHLIYSIDENNSPEKKESFCTKMLERIENEGILKRENFMKEEYIVIDRIGSKHEENRLDVSTMCVTNNGQTCVFTDCSRSRIIIYNVNNNSVLRCITLTEPPHGVTEVKEESHSPSLIAVTFPWGKQIIVMDIQSKPARIIHAIDTCHDECREIGYCNGKFILLYYDQVARICFIGVIDRGGGVLQRIYPNPYETVKIKRNFQAQLAFHKESKTIYVIVNKNMVLNLSMTGEVLNRSELPMITHTAYYICVDSAQNVYVYERFGHQVLILPGDLHNVKKIISLHKALRLKAMAVHKDMFYIMDCENKLTVLRHT